jgi:3-oxoacyl-[acyl-carrier protein] reductase
VDRDPAAHVDPEPVARLVAERRDAPDDLVTGDDRVVVQPDTARHAVELLDITPAHATALDPQQRATGRRFRNVELAHLDGAVGDLHRRSRSHHAPRVRTMRDATDRRRTDGASMNRVVVISGGGTGIGAAIARTVAEDGAHAVLLGRREEKLRVTASAIADDCGANHVSWLQADASEPGDVERVAAQVRDAHGTIDGVVNNAGGGGGLPGATLREVKESWHRTYDTNMITAVLLTTALAPMLRRPGGRIVNISSMSAIFGAGGAAYVAAKGALNAWTRALTYQYAKDGITANAVVPGFTPDTELFGGNPPPVSDDAIRARYPSGRAGTPQDIAGMVRYLLSPEASFVTSQVIEVAGGVLPPAY